MSIYHLTWYGNGIIIIQYSRIDIRYSTIALIHRRIVAIPYFHFRGIGDNPASIIGIRCILSFTYRAMAVFLSLDYGEQSEHEKKEGKNRL